jgi:uncharacterized Rmd1/YagE family protein
MDYKWTINKVQVAEDNLIVNVDLTVTGTDGDNTAAFAYSRSLARSATFIPYEELTEQQVLDWCFAPQVITLRGKLGEEQTVTKLLKNDGEAQVASQIARQSAQKAAEPALPWV